MMRPCTSEWKIRHRSELTSCTNSTDDCYDCSYCVIPTAICQPITSTLLTLYLLLYHQINDCYDYCYVAVMTAVTVLFRLLSTLHSLLCYLLLYYHYNHCYDYCYVAVFNVKYHIIVS